jgi:hypothetical protein
MSTGTTPRGFPFPNGDDRVSNGDNMIRALAEKIDAILPASAAGVASMPAAAAGALSTLVIAFPVGRFSAAPSVVMTPINNYGASPVSWHVSAITAANFTANLLRNGAALGAGPALNWVAVAI